MRHMSALDGLLSDLRSQAADGIVHSVREIVGLLIPAGNAPLADHCAMLALTSAILIQRMVVDRAPS